MMNPSGDSFQFSSRRETLLSGGEEMPRVESLESLITTRQNVSPKRLVEPGPNRAQQARLFRAAAAAPDHGMVLPWRFVIVSEQRRCELAEVFALALIDRDPGATLLQIQAAGEKAHRAPFLMLAIARLGHCEPNIPVLERVISLGCAIQNILLSAQCMALGSGLTSGQAMSSARLRTLFRLVSGEEAVCFVNIGTVSKLKAPRSQPKEADFVTNL